MAITVKKSLMGTAIAAMLIAVPFISGREGDKLQAYADVGGVWTWCNGETENVHPGMVATPEQCRALTQSTVGKTMGQVAALVTPPVAPESLAAYTSFAYNIGLTAFTRSKALALQRTGHLAESCDAMLNWYTAGGKDCRIRKNNCYGIIDRRQAERDLCLMGVPHVQQP